MRTYGFLTIRRLTEADLRAFVSHNAGEWYEDLNVRQGNIQKDGGEVILTLESGVLKLVEDDYWIGKFGFLPRSQVGIGVIARVDPVHNNASFDLGRSLGAQMVSLWGGVVDWTDD